jgi:DNA-binding SARP family transcriptional activator/Tfp pilus assembly protein PilF
MIRFWMLGGVRLTDNSGRDLDAVLRQPKRLALLAYLAIEGRSGYVRRDRLVGMFWPDSDEAHARHCLAQTLYGLRVAMSEDALQVRGTQEVGLSYGNLWSDVDAFERATREGRLEQALELYRRPLLDGFILPEPAFEQWVEVARNRLHDLAIDAALSLSRLSAQTSDLSRAVSFARLAARLSPFEEEPVRQWIRLLAQRGDFVGGQRVLEEFRKRLASELEVEPSGALMAEAVALRTQPTEVRVMNLGPTAEALSANGTARPDRNTTPAVPVPDLPGVPIQLKNPETFELTQVFSVGDEYQPERQPGAERSALEKLTANDCVLLARHHYDQFTSASLMKARRLYSRALRLEPENPTAHLGMSMMYFVLGTMNLQVMSAATAIARAKQHAWKAISLDPLCPESHAALGIILADSEFRWDDAERSFQTALSLSSTSALTYSRHSHLLGAIGRHDEAVAAMNRAVALLPGSTVILINAGWHAAHAGRLAEAERYLEIGRQLSPRCAWGAFARAELFLATDRLREALDELQAVQPGELLRQSYGLAMLAYILGQHGKKAEARRILAMLEQRNRDGRASLPELALAHLGMGDSTRALDQLEGMPLQIPAPSVAAFVRSLPQLGALRKRDRYQRALRQIGLPG